jgi:hypothetical protein
LHERDITAGGADGPTHSDCLKVPLDLGSRRGREQDAGGRQRDQRQRDEQVDHDSRGLVEQHANAGASDEPESGDPVAGRACLDEHLVEIARVAQPDLGFVDDRLGLRPKARRQRSRGDVELGRGEGVGDVVRLLGEAHDPLRTEPADVDHAV